MNRSGSYSDRRLASVPFGYRHLIHAENLAAFYAGTEAKFRAYAFDDSFSDLLCHSSALVFI
jgi:hypothetical protein